MSLTLSDCLDQHLEMRGGQIEMKVGVGRQPLLEGGGREGEKKRSGKGRREKKGNEERTGARDAARRVSAGERFLLIFYFSI